MDSLRKTPNIGITCDVESVADRHGALVSRYWLGEFYVKAVWEAGGRPWVLPYLSEGDAPEVLSKLDGLVISGGGADVPPSFYGEDVRPLCGPLCPKRHVFERALVHAAIQQKKPLLGVCGGMQVMNVALGGSLYQDVSERPHSHPHCQTEEKSKPSHTVKVTPGTLLAKLLGQATELSVNSTHHQMVRTLGEGLQVSAMAPDGVIEAIESHTHPFFLGVQWHPEAMTQESLQRAIYEGVVKASAAPHF